MKYQYILFDLDGMLVNTEEAVLKSAVYALNHYGIKKEASEIRFFMGPPLRESFLKCGLSEEQSTEAINIYRSRYDKYGLQECYVYEGIPQLLDRLNNEGRSLCVATSKYYKYSEMLLEHFGILKFFLFVSGASIDEKISKKADVVAIALQKFGLDESLKQKAVLIGDTRFDVFGAQANRIDCIGVNMNATLPKEHENAGATYVADGIAGLDNLLKTI